MSNIINQFAGLFTVRTRQIGGIVVDCFVRESHQSRIKLTEFPIEVGANINDHAIILPKELEIQGVISNIPSNYFFSKTSSNDFAAGSSLSRSASGFNLLLQLQQDREPINVVTGLRLYRNMVIVDIYADQTKETSGGAYFTCRFKEAIIISNTYTKIPSGQFRNGSTREQNSSTEERGRQQANEIPPDNRTRARQRLDGFIDGVKKNLTEATVQ
jgi:hypothetical protein